MIGDLATQHAPVSQLFPLPKSAGQWRAFELSPAQMDAYRKTGYVSGIRVLTNEQIDQLRGELAELMDPKHPRHSLFYEFHSNESIVPGTVLFHALGHWRITPGFHDLPWNPAVTVPASQLLEGPVRFWHDQIFYKPPKHGGVVAWHQDYSYWTRTQPMAHLTCWIGLDESTKDNGCLHYIPGSHQWDLLPITGLAGDMDSIREVLTDEQWETFNHPVAIELKAGECSFHHPLLIHGSFANRTDRPRRAAVVNFFRDGVRSASDQPLLQGVPVIPNGELMQGDFFPIVVNPAQWS